MQGTKRERLESRFGALRQARASWEPAWRDICEQLIPYRTVWEASDRNRGDKKDSKILNSTPTRALRTLVAGMMAGVTSPARDWFALTTVDKQLADVPAVKQYLDDCFEIIKDALQTSNWYNSLSNGVYLDLATIGTSAMFEEEGQGGRIRFSTLPVGEYFLDANHEGEIDTCFRDLSMSCRQMVQKFGLAACSAMVQQAWDRGKLEQMFMVCHAIMPNEEYQEGRYGRDGKAFASCWWEKNDPRKDHTLRHEGYHEFPILAPRWSVRPGDVYGRGPGWEVRGDCRLLQHKEEKLLRMLDKTVDPPMRAVGEVKRASLLPGDITRLGKEAGASFEPAMEIKPGSMDRLEQHILRDEARIKETMFANLWQMLIDDERAQRPTATEVEARRQEVMLMLGPLLESLNDGLLEKAIGRTFNILDRNDMLPLPPPELEGQPVKVKFISVMHQVQQSTGLVGLRTLVGETIAMAQAMPEALDKIDVDVVIDELGRITGVRPDAILSKDDVTEKRNARAQQEQAKQQGEAMLAATQGAKNLSTVDPTKMQELAATLSPVAAAQGVPL